MQPTFARNDRPDPAAGRQPSWPAGRQPSWPETPPAAPPGGPSATYGSPWGTPPGPPTTPPQPPRRRRRGSAVYAWLLVLIGLTLGALSLPATREALDTLGNRIPGVGALSRGLQPGRDVPTGWAGVTDAVDPGIVDIETRVPGGIGAGTGMILSEDGRVLTNYHVVEGASRIEVTVATTGEQYDADVLGADPDEDVALIQLRDAEGLTPVPIGDPATVEVGDPVAAIGNAGGVGGLPTVATGTVIGLDQSITASDQDGSGAEHLTGMIAIQADVQPGDSGGALATADGRVIGMTTAASTSEDEGRVQTRTGGSYGFAIPIDHAVAVAQTAAGTGSTSNGSTSNGSTPNGSTTQPSTDSRAILGVQLGTATSSAAGVPVIGVESGGPADALGLTAGDHLLALDGEAVGSVDDVRAILGQLAPGDRVTVTWSDTDGARHRGAAPLAAG